MIPYQTITNRKTAVRPSMTIPQGGGAKSITYPAVTWMVPPVSQDSFYEPESSFQKVVDPSQGRRFSKRKTSGDEFGKILMSEYKVINEKTERFLVSRDRSFKGKGYLGSFYPNSSTCYYVVETSPYLDCSWTEQAHFETWSRNNRDWPRLVTSYIDYDEVKDAISSTQLSAYSEALSGYDLLTELGESRETLAYLSSKLRGSADLLSKFKDMDPQAWEKGKNQKPRDLLRSSDKVLRRLGSRWMEFRYAIMPLIYSYKDIRELMGRNDIRYKTGRAKELIEPLNKTVIKPNTYFEEMVHGRIEVRSTFKTGWTSEGFLNLLQTGLTFNPFRTAWELTTLSFVVDWFLNIGDNISVMTTPNFSNQSAGCTVVKTDLQRELFLVDNSADVRITDIAATACFPAEQFVHEYPRDIYGLLQRDSFHNYERTLFSKPDPKLTWNPSLNWKRLLDGFVLSYQPTKKILRSLK